MTLVWSHFRLEFQTSKTQKINSDLWKTNSKILENRVFTNNLMIRVEKQRWKQNRAQMVNVQTAKIDAVERSVAIKIKERN